MKKKEHIFGHVIQSHNNKTHELEAHTTDVLV